MNDVEEYYLQHFGVKGMKWGVRKNRGASRSERKQAKKEIKSIRKEARKDSSQLRKAMRKRDSERVSDVNTTINNKRANNEAYAKAQTRATKNHKRTVRALQIAALTNATLSVVRVNNPQAYAKGAEVVGSVLKNVVPR